MEFSELKKQIVEKIKELSKFLGSAQMAISFEGRTLTEEQQREVLDIIAEYSDLHVICVVENNPELFVSH